MSFDAKMNLLREKLQQIQDPRYDRSAEDALSDMYYELVANNGEMLDSEGKLLVRYLAMDEVGGIDTLQQAMMTRQRYDGTNPGFFFGAFRVLTLFAHEESTLVAQKGGFDAILHGMDLCSSNNSVQQAGIVALVELSRKTRQCQTNPRTIIIAVVQAMEKFKESPTIFDLACKAMRLSCEMGVVLEDDIALRVHDSLMDGLMLFPLNEQAQHSGREVLGMWVGYDKAITMVEHRAETLCTLERILRTASAALQAKASQEQNPWRNIACSRNKKRKSDSKS